MKYSRSIVMLLLGTECFSEEEISNHKLRHAITYHQPLDVFAVLLLFFVYNPKFSPSKFLEYFCGMKKISDLKDGKQKFLDALSSAFDQLAQVRVSGESFFKEYHRDRNNWRYVLSGKAKELEKLFHCELELGAFWEESKRRGISVAYLGAYIYLLGISGKQEIDLSYCGKQKLVGLFDPGYNICGMRATILALVKKFSDDGIFGYGKRLENLDDRILHVKQNTLKGVAYHEIKEAPIKKPVPKTTYYNGKRIGTVYQLIDFEKPLRQLVSTVNHLNDMSLDFRHNGKHLRLAYRLDYQDNLLNKLLKFQWTGSQLSFSDWRNVTLGSQTPCAMISIDYLRSLYMHSRLRTGYKRIEFNTPLAWARSQATIRLLVEKAWEAMLKYPNNTTQMNFVFRENIYKYAKCRTTNKEVGEFFQFLTDRYFNFQSFLRNGRHIPTESNFLTESIGIFLNAASMNYSQLIPSIAGERVLIVPVGSEQVALQNLANSYRQAWGDTRQVKFKVSILDQTDYYHFCVPSKFKRVDEEWFPNSLTY